MSERRRTISCFKSEFLRIINHYFSSPQCFYSLYLTSFYTLLNTINTILRPVVPL